MEKNITSLINKTKNIQRRSSYVLSATLSFLFPVIEPIQEWRTCNNNDYFKVLHVTLYRGAVYCGFYI